MDAKTIDLLRREINHTIHGNNSTEEAIERIKQGTNEEISSVAQAFPLEGTSKKIVPGTVGEFLYGCSMKPRDLNVACTPSCLGGLKRPGTDYCDIQTYQLKDGEFTRINKVTLSASSAYLFTDTDDIPKDILNRISKDGIDSISVYINVPNTIDYRYLKDIELDPERKSIREYSQSTSYQSKLDTYDKNNKKDGGNNQWIWVGLIFLIILIIITIVFIYRRSRK